MGDINIKPKSIIVDGFLHEKFKKYCSGKSMKIGGIIEDLMKLYLKDPKIIQKMIDEYKESENLSQLNNKIFEKMKR